ncbi:DMT family transporter [Halobacillus mangrovi]|uniref:QacE family quaternary ammonium compound efflux SMR transporter n=1 Tax=Halobacillus mangrovi TaxID=402384 RepID=A0A1W5ZXE4_9BACI|nr:SMR family transporter [Halobacillus mangrovi]ARI77930.1 QacE family quaternary ammonium compound efflux SMR transporter [Halobacillus mangrovi]
MKNLYVLLFVSVIFEVIGAIFMKHANGFSDVRASVVVVISYSLALSLYIIITKNHEIGKINALWSGGGTTLVTILGILIFNESVTFSKMVGLGIIIVGICGLTLKPGRKKFITKRSA